MIIHVINRHLKDTVGCVNKYIKFCLNVEFHKQYKAMISGTTLLIEKLCSTNSHFRHGKHIIMYIIKESHLLLTTMLIMFIIIMYVKPT